MLSDHKRNAFEPFMFHIRSIIELRDQAARFARDNISAKSGPMVSQLGRNFLSCCGKGNVATLRIDYRLPLSWGTTTSTCSSEELPPLSVQVMMVV